jgi:glutathione synthase/RimK-type ligase-like ATP-grasp enzyme
MSVGHVLVLTNSSDATSDYLCSRFEQEKVRFCRFNTDQDCCTTTFVYHSGSARLTWSRSSVPADQVRAVVFRRPKPVQIRRNRGEYCADHAAGEWSEAIEGFLAHIEEKSWINHPARNSRASHKIEQLTRAERCGLHIPRTLVTNSIDKAEKFIDSETNGVIVKPLASGFIERANPEQDTVIYTREFKKAHRRYLKEIRFCPVLFQEMVPKIMDVRVTMLDGIIVATGIRATENDGTQRLDIRRNNMSDAEYVTVEPPRGVSAAMKRLIRSYGLRFAALDFGVTRSGAWVFFEVNPNGQWAWLDLYAKTNIASVFISRLKEG